MAEEFESRVVILRAGGTGSQAVNIELDADLGTVRVGKEISGSLFLSSGNISNQNAKSTIRLLGQTAELHMGGHVAPFFSTSGKIYLYHSNNESNNSNGATVVLDGSDAALRMGGRFAEGIKGVDGDIYLFNDQGVRTDADTATIHLNGATGHAGLGRRGSSGALFIKDNNGEDIIVLDGDTGNVGLGRDGNGGQLFLKDDTGTDTIVLNGTTGNIGLGKNGRAGNVFVKNNAGANTIELSGGTGDIILRNADCAEEFDISEEIEDEVEPGTVMVLDSEGKLRQSTEAYDKKVAGVISGAGDYKPAIVLDRQSSQNLRVPVALMGKVYCKVDAQYGAIEVGDLLTTSSTPGHAMRADDYQQGFGAVIGKALKPLKTGCGLIPIIIALQ